MQMKYPFSTPLKLAVITQELIGEQINGSTDPHQIPASMVMFTNEPTFIGGEEFRVMRLSVTWGHGEGVVGSQGINSDTVLILNSVAHPGKLYILADNNEKPERLAPVRNPVTKKIELQRIPNSPEMAQSATLDPAMLARLHLYGVLVEKYYGGIPMDLELVVLDGVIYPVQARPINRPKILPTFFDTKKVSQSAKEAIISKMKGDTVVFGMGMVETITDPSQILISKTLQAAQDDFKKGRHKLVIIGQPEPANSHPVVNFSGMGIPCLHIPDLAYVRQQIKKIDSKHSAVVCVQSGTIHIWDKASGNPEDFIHTGYVVHPAKIGTSLQISRPINLMDKVRKQEIPQDVQETITRIQAAHTNDEALQHLQTLQANPFVANLKTKRIALAEKLKGCSTPLKEGDKVIKMLEQLETKVERAFSETQAVLLKIKKSDCIL